MRRRDFNNGQPDNYSGLTGYDEMSTRQVGDPQPAYGFADSTTAAQNNQPPAAQPSAPLFTPPPQNPLGGLFGTAQQPPVQNNGYAGNGNNGYAQQSFFGGQTAPMTNGGYDRQNNGYAPQQNNAYAPQSNPNIGYAGQNAERPMVFKIDREPNGYIYEYSDRLEYYRYTGAGMMLINSIKKDRRG